MSLFIFLAGGVALGAARVADESASWAEAVDELHRGVAELLQDPAAADLYFGTTAEDREALQELDRLTVAAREADRLLGTHKGQLGALKAHIAELEARIPAETEAARAANSERTATLARVDTALSTIQAAAAGAGGVAEALAEVRRALADEPTRVAFANNPAGATDPVWQAMDRLRQALPGTEAASGQLDPLDATLAKEQSAFVRELAARAAPLKSQAELNQTSAQAEAVEDQVAAEELHQGELQSQLRLAEVAWHTRSTGAEGHGVLARLDPLRSQALQLRDALDGSTADPTPERWCRLLLVEGFGAAASRFSGDRSPLLGAVGAYGGQCEEEAARWTTRSAFFATRWGEAAASTQRLPGGRIRTSLSGERWKVDGVSLASANVADIELRVGVHVISLVDDDGDVQSRVFTVEPGSCSTALQDAKHLLRVTPTRCAGAYDELEDEDERMLTTEEVPPTRRSSSVQTQPIGLAPFIVIATAGLGLGATGVALGAHSRHLATAAGDYETRMFVADRQVYVDEARTYQRLGLLVGTAGFGTAMLAGGGAVIVATLPGRGHQDGAPPLSMGVSGQW